jgi:hypothetical protein
MSKTIVTALKVDTGNSAKTIKDLKAEIAQLKKNLEGAEIGTEQFEKASVELNKAQTLLKDTLKTTSQSAKNAKGSYDDLVATMAELKKEWRATNDVAKRNELGKQIDVINSQLKELDASTGNFQRNVGDYENAIKNATKDTVDYGTAIAQLNKETEGMRGAFDGINKLASGIAGGFSAYQGIMALAGVENENFEKTMVKVTSAMALAQGVGKIKDLIEGFSQLKTSIASAQMALKALSFGGVIGGVVAVTAGFVALIGNMDKIKKYFNDVTTEEQKAKLSTAEFNKELTTLINNTAINNVVRIKELSKSYSDLGDNLAGKEKFIKTYADELKNMGIEIDNVNTADDIFINKTDDYVNALIARAKASAIIEKATEEYKKALEDQAVLEAELVEAKVNQQNGTPEKTFWQNVREAIIMSSVGEGAPVQEVTNLVNGINKEIADDAVNIAQKNLDDFNAQMEQNLTDAFNKANDLNAMADKILNPTSSTTTVKPTLSSSTTVTSTTTKDMSIYDGVKSSLDLMTNEDKLESLKKLLEDESLLLDDRLKLIEERNRIELELENEKITKLQEKQTFLKSLKTETEQTEIDDLNAQFEQYKSQFNLNTEELKTLEEWKQEQLKKIRDKYRKQEEQANEELTRNIVATTTTALSSASNILDALASNVDKSNEEGFEKAKKLQIASATMSMLAGITNALAGTFTTHTGVWDMVLAGIQAATIATTGAIQINNIRKQTYEGSASSTPSFDRGSMSRASVVPNVNISDYVPINYTKNLLTDTETTELNKATKVYVTEEDITNTQHRVSVTQNNSSF